jgi:hypothetical protein
MGLDFIQRRHTSWRRWLLCGQRNNHIEVSTMTARADKKHFTAAEVFALTGVPQQKAYQWDDRHVTVPSRNDKLASSSGDPHLRSIETVYQIAITAALVSLGLLPKLSARAARKFTDSPSPGREAGQLFARAKTVLVISAAGVAVSNIDFDARVSDLSSDGVALVVDINAIVNRVDAELTKFKH